MTRALTVPESPTELGWSDARSTVGQVHWARLTSRSIARLRAADGFSHARASAFVLALLLVEGTIAVLGLAIAIGSPSFSRTVTDVAETLAPGPAGQLLTSAVQQAQDTGTSHQYTALIVGLLAALVTGTTAMGQFERSCNRIYGIDSDRPTAVKYGRALVLAVTAGLAAALAVTVMVLGRPISESIEDSSVQFLWLWGRWPLIVVVLVAAVTLLLRFSPNRRQPSLSWLAMGAGTSVILMVASSVLLAWFFKLSTTFGDTYGPLAGLIGLLLWCFLMAASGLYGIAMTAQLEAEHAGIHGATEDDVRLTGGSGQTILSG